MPLRHPDETKFRDTRNVLVTKRSERNPVSLVHRIRLGVNLSSVWLYWRVNALVLLHLSRIVVR